MEGEIIVKLKKASQNSYLKFSDISSLSDIESIDDLNKKHNVQSVTKLFENCEDSSLSRIYKLKLPKDGDIYSILEEYRNNENVEYAELNFILRAFNTPNDPDFESQWGLHNTGQTGGTVDADIDAPEAWDLTHGSSKIVIAIVDTGVDYTHPDLAKNCIKGYDFVNNDNDPMDDQGHGTHCAGIAAAVTNNGIGIAGVSWNSKIMPIKTLDSIGDGSYENAAKSIVYATENGANIISNSYGGPANANSHLLKDAINYSYNKGVILIAAAGNENTNEKRYPAAYDQVIAVAATDENDDRWYDSNYGDWVDLAAPGEYILSTKLGGGYTHKSGTSMACPHVAGIAALILSRDSSLSAEKVKEILLKSTDKLDTNEYIGTGRANAYLAVKNTKSIERDRRQASSYLFDVFDNILARFYELFNTVLKNIVK